MKNKVYSDSFVGLWMAAHDDLSYNERMQAYATDDGIEEYDHTWSRKHPHPRQHYKLTPAQLRRLGVRQ